MDILPQLLVSALVTGSIYALASAGLSLTYGLLRILNFAHGHFMMLGAYLFYLAHVEWTWGILSSSLFTGIAIALFAAVALQVFALPFLRFSFFLPLVSTLALGTMIEAVVSLVFGVNVKSLSTSRSFTSYEFGGVYITPIQIWIIVSSLVLLGALAFWIHQTSFGRRVRALALHKYAAQSLGISYRRTSFGIFIVGSLAAAFAGVLVGFETNLQPTMGGSYTMKVFAAMVLGGLGKVWGTVLGSYILGLIENLSIGLDFWGYSLPAGYKDAFAFFIILMVLLVRPQGLFQRAVRRA